MTGIEWIPFQDGFLGILPCGITMVVIRLKDGPFAGAYQARFGTCDIRKVFWDEEEAKQKCIILTRSVLDSCLHILEESL
jgi:hypothetical protein